MQSVIKQSKGRRSLKSGKGKVKWLKNNLRVSYPIQRWKELLETSENHETLTMKTDSYLPHVKQRPSCRLKVAQLDWKTLSLLLRKLWTGKSSPGLILMLCKCTRTILICIRVVCREETVMFRKARKDIKTFTRPLVMNHWESSLRISLWRVSIFKVIVRISNVVNQLGLSYFRKSFWVMRFCAAKDRVYSQIQQRAAYRLAL